MTTVARTALVLALAACGGKGAATPAAPAPAAVSARAAPIDTAGLPHIRFARGMLHGSVELCTFVTQPLDGDGQITCRVASFPKDQFGWAGLMLRDA